MGVPFFVPGWHGSFGLAGPCGGAYAIRPYMYPAKFAGVRRRPYAIRPYMYPAKFAGVRRRPYAIRPYMGTRHSCTRPYFAAPAGAIPDAFSTLLSDSIFAAVFGDAKSDGPVRDVKRESSVRLEQCPLL